VTIAPTCTAEGVETRICRNDNNHTQTRVVAALGHDWSDWIVTIAPTCTAEGVETRICRNDNNHTQTRAVAALGHDWSDWVVTTEPTETTDGMEVRICGNDKTHVEMRVVPTGGKLYFVPNDEGTACSVGLADYGVKEIIIPSIYNEMPVTTILPYAFAFSPLISVSLPDTLTVIEDGAFMGSKLEEINLVGVEIIKSFAFAMCDNMKYIVISDNMKYIGYGVFMFCDSLTKIYYGGDSAAWDAITIEENSFEFWDAIRYFYSATKPQTTGNYWHYVDGVPTVWEQELVPTLDKILFCFLEDGTYGVCVLDYTVTELIIPPTHDGKPVSTIIDFGFSFCRLLTRVVLPDSITTIGFGAFMGCPLLEVVVIGRAEIIGDYAFSYCDLLSYVIMPDSVSYIGRDLFTYSSNLTKIYYGGDSAAWDFITIKENSSEFWDAVIYFYSATQLQTAGNYWRYVDGVPTAWQ